MRDTQSAKDIVLAFYDVAVNEKDVERTRLFLGDTYIQHNPHVADGPEAFLRFVKFRRDNHPDAYNKVELVVAEGDYVVMQVHSVVPGFPSRKIVEIFRVEDGRPVEHWDTVQTIPVELFPPINDNGLF
ncbi:ester cyclase [Nocardia sp. NPDC051570]|uniref:nuclear transport factor 2 family protein n=1 Tax=Nocardia sp. NPDC051570 TaxID=3364324 RepID=UPI00379782AD